MTPNERELRELLLRAAFKNDAGHYLKCEKLVQVNVPTKYPTAPASEIMTDKPFIYADCPTNENGHRIAKTRDGRDVRLLADDVPGIYPIAGVIAGNTTLCQWTADGRFHSTVSGSANDLMPAKRVRVFWVNLYPNNGFGAWISEERAENAATLATAHRIGPARRIEIEE